jgi:DNA polymerase III delta prime subunit
MNECTHTDNSSLINAFLSMKFGCLGISGIVSETKYNKTRSTRIKTSVFTTSNNIEQIIPPLQSRFFIIKLGPYTYEQFYDITLRLLVEILGVIIYYVNVSLI